jgi:iron complex transport system ATP-binding protein
VLRQDNALAARLTVADLVAFGRYPHSKGRLTAVDREPIERAIGFLGLAAYRDRFLDELSGGQRQRAFVAMVLAQDTDAILLDEPLNNLDMRHAVAMMQILRRAADDLGKTVVVVLHDINFAASYCDRIVAMREGAVVRDGTPDEIVTPEALRAIYDMEMQVVRIDERPVCVFWR